MAIYELRIANRLGESTAVYFPEFTIHSLGDGSSTLIGDVVDQAALHGVFARIRDLGITLLACNIIDTPQPPQQKE